MTQLFAVKDLGHSGGSWLAYCCNFHPAKMRVLGELHYPGQLVFDINTPTPHYDSRAIDFLQSQMDQGVAAAGVIKCFWALSEQFILGHGGRIIQIVRNPMGVTGFKMYLKEMSILSLLGRKPRDRQEDFRAHMLYYQNGYERVIKRARQQPIIRIEDLNRSCGADGEFFKAVMEYMTQTPWPKAYIKHVQRWCMPGYHYPIEIVQHEGVVVSIETIPFTLEKWRTSWADDPGPREYWEDWRDEKRAAFLAALAPVSERLGYNCTDNPGFTEVDWPLRDSFPWAKAGHTLKAIPYDLPYAPRLLVNVEANVPRFREADQ